MQTLQNIFKSCRLKVQSSERVHGGDINDAYCLLTTGEKYFLKVNDRNKYPGMFEKEAKGLDLLRKNSSFAIPGVINHGIADGKQYLVLEWFDKGPPQKDMWEKFGEGLASMHQQSKEYFGLDDDNYIGSLQQHNDQHGHWSSFYAECRIKPLVKRLVEEGAISLKDMATADKLCNNLKNIFPREPPSLLHGDLWAGNYLVHSSGYAAIYDPAVYFGHREMDIAMTRLFGGFDQRFYKAYNERYPLEKDWEKRLPLAQLYPILVHAVLFGGHYCIRAMDIVKRFC
jgi:fructosamine-3-kinase